MIADSAESAARACYVCDMSSHARMSQRRAYVAGEDSIECVLCEHSRLKSAFCRFYLPCDVLKSLQNEIVVYVFPPSLCSWYEAKLDS